MAKRGTLAGLLLGTLILYGCSGEQVSTEPTVVPVASVEVTPGSATLVALGVSKVLAATARDAGGA